MKIAVLALAVLVAVAVRAMANPAQPDAAALVIAALQKCATDSGLTQAQLNRACEGHLPEGDGQARSYKCFAKCVQQGVGIMSADGTIDPARSTALVRDDQKAIMQKIAEACLGDGKEDACDKAYAVDTCYAAKNKTMYIANCKGLITTVSA